MFFNLEAHSYQRTLLHFSHFTFTFKYSLENVTTVPFTTISQIYAFWTLFPKKRSMEL